MNLRKATVAYLSTGEDSPERLGEAIGETDA
ncbi:MAG: hypothetical protein ACI9EF_000842 [Pseudohongiellaceae bacterium]|jgi:hypothetical protein